MEKETLQKVHQWMLGDDTGASSKFLCQLAVGNQTPARMDHPWDPADFGRCYRFLKLLNEEEADRVLLWASHRSEVWERMVEDWDQLVALFEEESPSGTCPKLYERMKNIINPVCEYCGGTGEVTTMEAVYAGEPHMAPIGTKKCICQIE